MRTSILPTCFLSLLALGVGGCKSAPTADGGGATAAAESAQPAEKAAPADNGGNGGGGRKAANGGNGNGGGGEGNGKAEKAAAAKKKEDKKSDEEKSKEQKKWDEALKDLEEAKGLFTVHHGPQKLLLELDEKALGREFLYYGALNSGLGSNSIYRGAMLYDNPFVLHFETRGKNHVILRSANTQYMPGDDAREQRVLGQSVSDGIVKAFKKVAELEDEGRMLIDLGSWFSTDNLQLSRRIGGGKWAPSKDLSLVEAVKAYPRNVELHYEMVYTGATAGSGNSSIADGRGVTLAVQHSLVALPEDGYKPRKFDQRVGFFYTERKDLFDRQAEDDVHRYINRWRLQKKDPTADVSDPVEPIVYWIDRSTPAAFRQAVREGIEAWEPAFRKAGFSNAIIAKQMPDDATWDAADVEHAVIRWSEDENVGFAIGPSRQDPRTGETFDADITMQANFLNTYANRFRHYIEERSTMSKEAILAEYEAERQKVVPEGFDPRRHCTMLGEEFALQIAYASMLLDVVAPGKTQQEFLQDMIREVTAHEVGHTLGLRHNFKSSTQHDLADLWNPEITRAKGVSGSFMDYPAVLINKPGEPQGEFFQSTVGLYDYWAIEYGYREFGSNEDAQLAQIAARSNEPGLEFGTDEDSFIGDPFSVTWDMGKNPVAFSEQQLDLAEWGLSKMMDRAVEPGDGFHKYATYYAMFYSMYARNHFGLGRFIGGYSLNRDLVGQEGGRQPIVPVDQDLQRQALDVIIEKGLAWDGGIPAEQRLLLANQKYGSFGSWFDFWSFDPLPRIVNNARFSALAPLMSTFTHEQLEGQNRVAPGGLTPREVASRTFDAVWVDSPDEHDLWIQVDYVNMALMAVQRDTTPQVLALFDEMIDRSAEKLAGYASSGDATVAAHGKWLGRRIQRFRDRQTVEF